MRHGKAETSAHDVTDAHRKLTKKGHEEIVAIADWMVSQELQFDLIATSPLVRAQETAAIVADVLGAGNLVTWKALVPGSNPDTVCREINKYKKGNAILLVGHEPLLSTLIGQIIAGNTGAGIVMTKGALAKIRNFSYSQHPSGELHWLITAKQMAGLL